MAPNMLTTMPTVSPTVRFRDRLKVGASAVGVASGVVGDDERSWVEKEVEEEGTGEGVWNSVVVTVSKIDSITLLDSARLLKLADGDTVFDVGNDDDSGPEVVISADGWTSADDFSSVGIENQIKLNLPVRATEVTRG